jgi:AcrR family transcriptional regulator
MDLGGLPMSSFTPRDEREELMALFAAVVYEHGLALTCLADLARRAGVPLEQVTGHWPTPIDCLLDTVAASTQQLFGRVAAAFMEAGGDGPVALHRALSTMVYELAEVPETTYLSVVELPRLGPLVYQRQDRTLDLFCELLHNGFAALDEPPPSREIVTLCIGGGVWESIYRHAAQRTLHQLPDSLPAISYVCVSTFFGVEEALRVSAPSAVRPAPLTTPAHQPRSAVAGSRHAHRPRRSSSARWSPPGRAVPPRCSTSRPRPPRPEHDRRP